MAKIILNCPEPSRMDDTKRPFVPGCILKYIFEYKHVSFAELDNKFDISGDGCIINDKNVILWAGLSQEFIAFFIQAKKDSVIKLDPCGLLVYICDGRVPQTQMIGKRPPKNGYKKPRWAPCVINPGQNFRKVWSEE